MRSAAEIRNRQLEALQAMLLRPSMWGDGRGYENTVRATLLELASIDEREAAVESALADLEAEGLFLSCGVAGVLERSRGPDGLTDAIASVYARVAAELQYFKPARRLSAAEWKGVARVPAWAREAPRSRDEVEARFGQPSYVSTGRTPSVLAYAGPNDRRWLYFDFEEGGKRSRLELVRLPRRTFARALIDLRQRPLR